MNDVNFIRDNEVDKTTTEFHTLGGAHLDWTPQGLKHLGGDFISTRSEMRRFLPQINSFSELATASVNGASSMTSRSYGFILIFIAGMALGSFITWRATRRL